MSKSKKAILTGSFILLIFHIVKYFFYNGDILQASMGAIAMIGVIAVVLVSKESEA